MAAFVVDVPSSSLAWAKVSIGVDCRATIVSTTTPTANATLVVFAFLVAFAFLVVLASSVGPADEGDPRRVRWTAPYNNDMARRLRGAARDSDRMICPFPPPPPPPPGSTPSTRGGDAHRGRRGTWGRNGSRESHSASPVGSRCLLKSREGNAKYTTPPKFSIMSLRGRVA